MAVDASNVDQGHHAVALDHLLAALGRHVRNYWDLVFDVWSETEWRADHQAHGNKVVCGVR